MKEQPKFKPEEMKACRFCTHAMDAEASNQVYCIKNPPVPVMTNNGVIGAIPAMMKWGKCDAFDEGERQAMIQPPPLPDRPKGEEALWKKTDRLKFNHGMKQFMDFMDKWSK